MDALSRELKMLQRILYKSKNAHRCALYYRKAVHVYRTAKQLVTAHRKRRVISVVIHELSERCAESYVAFSSCIAVGHHIPLAITGMAVVARIFTAAQSTTPLPPLEDTEDELSDLFNEIDRRQDG